MEPSRATPILQATEQNSAGRHYGTICSSPVRSAGCSMCSLVNGSGWLGWKRRRGEVSHVNHGMLQVVTRFHRVERSPALMAGPSSVRPPACTGAIESPTIRGSRALCLAGTRGNAARGMHRRRATCGIDAPYFATSSIRVGVNPQQAEFETAGDSLCPLRWVKLFENARHGPADRALRHCPSIISSSS